MAMLVMMLSIVMLTVAFFWYAERRYSECCYAECRSAGSSCLSLIFPIQNVSQKQMPPLAG
jgi:hypothetical protein